MFLRVIRIAGFVTVCRYKSRCGVEYFTQPIKPQCFIHDVELNPHTRVAFDKST